MDLRKKYNQLFEGKSRSNDSTLTEAPMVRAFPKMKTDAEKRAAGVVDRDYGGGASPGGSDGPEEFDIKYWTDQLNTILESIDDYHQELGTTMEMKSQETGDYMYDTAEKQISRYINGAQKQLEGLQKYLERQKGNL